MASKKDLAAALDRAAVPTLALIKADAASTSGVVADLLNEMEGHVFDEGINVEKLAELAGSRDNSLSTKFRRAIGCPPLRYLRLRQLEVAERLLRDFGLKVGEVGTLVGTADISHFGRRFKAWCGKKPLEVRFQEAPPEVDYQAWYRTWRGELSEEEAVWFHDRYRRLYPQVAGRLAGDPGDEPRQAEELWRRVRGLPFEEQRARVRRHLFRTTALFDLLRRKSRQEGRRDRRRGVEVARLALASLVRCPVALTERGHDLEALGLAELANALRLADDFVGSAEAFRRAYAEWETPRQSPDPRVLAEIYGRHGSLLMFERRYDEALELLDKSVALSRQHEDRRSEIMAVVQRAAVRGYMGSLKEALRDLEYARRLTEESGSAFLRFNVQFNLVNARNRLGEYRAAASGLTKLKTLRDSSIYQLREDEVEHLEGNILEGLGDLSAAEERYKQAHRRFTESKERRGAAFAAVDLAILYSRQDRHKEVIGLVSGLIPVLSSLRLHPETLAAVRLLAQALEKRNIELVLLRRIRKKLRNDPLLLLS